MEKNTNKKKCQCSHWCSISYGNLCNWSWIPYTDRTVHRKPQRKLWLRNLSISYFSKAIVQLNVWRVLCVSGMRGQDVANKVLPGLGYVIAFLVVAGGLVFNIGNVGGGALGFNSLLGIPTTYGSSSQEQSQSVYSFTKMH